MFLLLAVLFVLLEISGFRVISFHHLNGFGHSAIQLKIVGMTILSGVYGLPVYAGVLAAFFFFIFFAMSDLQMLFRLKKS